MKKIGGANDVFQAAVHLEELIDLVLQNYSEWEKDLLSFSVDNIVFNGVSKIHFQRKAASRRIINLMTVCRMYIDQSKKTIRKILPAISKDEVEKYFSNKYDESIEYRFMEQLRNSVQHSTLPIHSFIQSGGWREVEGEDKLFSTVIPKLNVELLRDDKRFKKSVLDEVECFESLDLRRYCRKYVKEIFDIHKAFRGQYFDTIEEAENVMECYQSLFFNEFSDELPRALHAVIRDGDEVGGWISVADRLGGHLGSLYEDVLNVPDLSKVVFSSGNGEF